jgi:hypothetical protein
MSAAFSAIIMVEAHVFADGMLGITEASATRNPVTPWTRNSSSTTADGSLDTPIREVPITW